MDRGFFSFERWSRKQSEREYVFKGKKIKKPNIYPKVEKWGSSHFPAEAYSIYTFAVPLEILNKTELIVNRIYSVDEFGSDVIWQAIKHLQCPMPEYIKYQEDWNPFGSLDKYFEFISPEQTEDGAQWFYPNILEIFLKNATVSPYVRYVDRVDCKILQTNKLVSLVEGFM